MTLLNVISGIVTSGVLMHVGYVMLIMFLLFDKRKQYLMLDVALEKNLCMSDQLQGMRIELKQLHTQLVQLIRENHELNHEIQLLTMQVNALRDEVQNSKKR